MVLKIKVDVKVKLIPKMEILLSLRRLNLKAHEINFYQKLIEKFTPYSITVKDNCVKTTTLDSCPCMCVNDTDKILCSSVLTEYRFFNFCNFHIRTTLLKILAQMPKGVKVNA